MGIFISCTVAVIFFVVVLILMFIIMTDVESACILPS